MVSNIPVVVDMVVSIIFRVYEVDTFNVLMLAVLTKRVDRYPFSAGMLATNAACAASGPGMTTSAAFIMSQLLVESVVVSHPCVI